MAVRRSSYSRGTSARQAGAFLISFVAVTSTFLPSTASAGLIDDLKALFKKDTSIVATSSPDNIQTMVLPVAAHNIVPAPARGGGDVTIVDDSALLPAEGPSGTIANIVKPKNSTISVYVVRSGDTLSEIGEMFGVSPNTIRWANDLSPSSKLKVGQTLTILPVTGVKYKVKSGDTIASLAKKFDANADDILNFNGIDGDLAIGTEIIIPDGEIAAGPTPTPKTPGTKPKGAIKQIIVEATSAIGNYAAPLARYVKTQGVHGYNAVDLAAPVGTPIMASAAGDVIIAKPSGWNGGYGSYVVLHHDDGSQTLYGHASRVIVSEGQRVVQGQVIAYVGSTGKSTGSHLHFEIRNGVRNPF
ncbi:MAG: hypothetical protein RLZZ342_599 [Candidatus Parcubacteria bacterium]